VIRSSCLSSLVQEDQQCSEQGKPKIIGQIRTYFLSESQGQISNKRYTCVCYVDQSKIRKPDDLSLIRACPRSTRGTVVSVEDVERYHRVRAAFLPTWRKPNSKAWERYNEDTCAWERVSSQTAFRALKETVDRVLEPGYRSERWYRENFYGLMGTDCSPCCRGIFLKEIMTLPPDQSP